MDKPARNRDRFPPDPESEPDILNESITFLLPSALLAVFGIWAVVVALVR